MGGNLKKQFINLAGLPILTHTLKRLLSSDKISEIVVAVPADEIALSEGEIVKKSFDDKPVRLVEGGATRHESVANAFAMLDPKTEIVLVHDGVRPFVTLKMIESVITLAQKYGAGTVAVPARDTLKKVDGDTIIASIPRDDIVRIQTPQAFRYDLLSEGLKKAERDGFIATDESSLVERLGLPVKTTQGSDMNIKITTIDDLKIAEAFLKL